MASVSTSLVIHKFRVSAGGTNLGIQTFVNGAPMSPVQLDTSQAATDTIDYVATDQTGLTSTSTRTVIIESAEAPSIVPTR